MTDLRKQSNQYFQEFFQIISQNAKILDVGAGTNSIKKLFPRLNVTTLDDSYDVDIKCDLTKGMCLPDNQYDVVVLSQTLEHIPDTKFLLAECFRVLKFFAQGEEKEGGWIIGAVPFLRPIHQEPRDFVRLTEYGLRFHLSEAGFTEISIKPLGVHQEAYFTLQRLIFEKQPRVLRKLQSILNIFLQPLTEPKFAEGYAFKARKNNAGKRL